MCLPRISSVPDPPDLIDDDRLELSREFFSVWLAASAAAAAAASSSILRLGQSITKLVISLINKV